MKNRWLALHVWGIALSWLMMLLFTGAQQPFFTVLVFAIGGYFWWGAMPHSTKGFEPHPAIVRAVEDALNPPPPSPERQEALKLAWEDIADIERNAGIGDRGVVQEP